MNIDNRYLSSLILQYSSSSLLQPLHFLCVIIFNTLKKVSSNYDNCQELRVAERFYTRYIYVLGGEQRLI